MYIWTCKKCGQSFDDMFCGDYICDDCYDKMKREEKKQKRRNSPFFRFLSFALALSFMLCIFSGIGVASAEEVTTEAIEEIKSSGTYLGYDVLKLQPEEKVDYYAFNQIFDNYRNADTNINVMDVYLMAFDESGKSHFYGYQNGYIGSLEYKFNEHYSYFGSGGATQLYDSYVEENYLTCSFYYDATSLKRYFWEDGNTLPTIYTYNFTYTDGLSGFSGYHSSDLYLVFCPYNSSEVKYNDIFSSLLSGTKTNDFVDTSVNSSQPQANFYTCKSSPFSDSSHGLHIKSWLKDGEQYPYFGWWINDNGNNHKYKVVFSYNDTQRGLFEAFYQSTKQNPAFSNGWWIEHAFPILAITKDSMIVSNTLAKETGFADFMADKTWWLWHYNTLFTLEHSSMDFTNSESCNKAYSINLSDYSSIYEYLFYRAQIVDVTTGNILDTVYFTSQETYSKSDSGYGSKVYDYGDNFNGMINDLTNNNPTVTPDNQGSFNADGDVIDSPVIDENGNTNWNNIDLGGLYSPLNFGLSAVSDFFQSLWTIFPREIRTIIISGMSLIVVLRILGR